MIELSLIVRVTVILGLCLTVLSATRRASASLRSLVLAVTFGMLLALPIATEVVPRVRVPLPTRVTATRPAVLMRSPATAPPRADAPLAGHARTVPTRPPSTVWQLLLVLWATGATLVVVPTLLAMIAAWRLRRRGTPWTRGTVMVTVFARGGGPAARHRDDR